MELLKGERVRLTKFGIANGLEGKSGRRLGIVTTKEKNGLVNVHRIGDMEGKNGLYSTKYWERISEVIEYEI